MIYLFILDVCDTIKVPVKLAEVIFLQAVKLRCLFSVACCVKIPNLNLFLPEVEQFCADSTSLNI